MKTFTLFTLLFLATTLVNVAQAGSVHYNVTLTFIDDTKFTGTFDYDSSNQQITNLQGTLNDVLMGNVESLNYQLGSGSDGKGGINVYAFELNTSSIATNPPVNNNAGVRINFNATNPTLGPTDSSQLAYMDCSAGALMGKTCMYYLSSYNPKVPMQGGHGILSEVITSNGGQPQPVSQADCLFNWAETYYSQLFSPAGATSQTSAPYYYRYYQHTNSYVGVSSDNNHVYYLGPDGILQDVGPSSAWFTTAGC